MAIIDETPGFQGIPKLDKKLFITTEDEETYV